MDQEDKVRENRLRRMAERRGLKLEKSRRRDPLATDFGKYWFVELSNASQLVDGFDQNGLPAFTLDDVEARLTDEKYLASLAASRPGLR